MVRILVSDVITRVHLCWDLVRTSAANVLPSGAAVMGTMGSEALMLRARASCPGGVPARGDWTPVGDPQRGLGLAD